MRQLAAPTKRRWFEVNTNLIALTLAFTDEGAPMLAYRSRYR